MRFIGKTLHRDWTNMGSKQRLFPFMARLLLGESISFSVSVTFKKSIPKRYYSFSNVLTKMWHLPLHMFANRILWRGQFLYAEIIPVKFLNLLCKHPDINLPLSFRNDSTFSPYPPIYLHFKWSIMRFLATALLLLLTASFL